MYDTKLNIDCNKYTVVTAYFIINIVGWVILKPKTQFSLSIYISYMSHVALFDGQCFYKPFYDHLGNTKN